MNYRSVLCALFAVLAACSYDPAYDVTCTDEGARDGVRTCENGVWVSSDASTIGDANPNNEADGSAPDAGTPDLSSPDADMGCDPESNVEFCGRLGFDCDEVTAPDNCGVERTITCGTCEAPQTCGAVDPNVCGCVPESATEFCTRLVKTCDMVTDLDNCGVERTEDCGTCTMPAECGGGGTPNVCACPDQSDADFCANAMPMAAECGALTGLDVCGQMRTVSCGTCNSPEECGAADANQCACPGDAAVCTALGFECDMVMVAACGATVDCGGCQPNASCAANSCECDRGFVPDGLGNCEDVDECGDMTDNCDANASCTNTPGGFDCSCNGGYMGDGTSCSDIDECATMADDCDSNATCTNIPGSFNCACDAGYTGDGRTCTDDDECADMTDNCDANATCTNTPGSFTCACDSGYTGNGVMCSDVDECATMADNCDVNATCTNTPGSFDCMCNPGFMGNGVTCTPAPLVVSVQTVQVALGSSDLEDSTDLPQGIVAANAVPFISLRTNSDQLQFTTVDVTLFDDRVEVRRPDNDVELIAIVAVVEFDPTRVAVQSTSYADEGNTSITTVDRSASFMTFSGAIDHNNDEVDNRMVSGHLNQNGDGIVIGRESTSGSHVGRAWIAESLDGGFNVQHVSGSMSGSDTSTDLTITAVDLTRSFILYSNQSTETGTDLNDGAVSCELTSATTVTCERNGGNDAVTNLRVQVVEVTGATVQRDTTTFNGSSSMQMGTVSAVTAAQAMVNLGQIGSTGVCRTDETDNDDFASAASTAELAGTTNVAIRRSGAADAATTCTWEVIEWP